MGSPDPSESLLGRVRHGDHAALDELLGRHLPGLRAFVRLRMGAAVRNHEASTDLVQSVCRELLVRADRLEHGGEAGFKRWLYRAAERKITDRQRYLHAAKRDIGRERRATTADGDSNDELLACYQSLCTPSRDAAAREQLERVEAAFDQLSEDHKRAILGVRMLGWSHAELGEQLGRSEGAARMLLSRALAHLTELVDERT